MVEKMKLKNDKKEPFSSRSREAHGRLMEKKDKKFVGWLLGVTPKSWLTPKRWLLILNSVVFHHFSNESYVSLLRAS